MSLPTIIGVDPATWGFTYAVLTHSNHGLIRIGEMDVSDKIQTASHRLHLFGKCMSNVVTLWDTVQCVYIEQQPQHSGKAKQIAHWLGGWCAGKNIRVTYVRPHEKYVGRFDSVEMSELSGASAHVRKKAAREWMERVIPHCVDDGTVVEVERSRMADIGDAVAIDCSGHALDNDAKGHVATRLHNYYDE